MECRRRLVGINFLFPPCWGKISYCSLLHTPGSLTLELLSNFPIFASHFTIGVLDIHIWATVSSVLWVPGVGLRSGMCSKNFYFTEPLPEFSFPFERPRLRSQRCVTEITQFPRGALSHRACLDPQGSWPKWKINFCWEEAVRFGGCHWISTPRQTNICQTGQRVEVEFSRDMDTELSSARWAGTGTPGKGRPVRWPEPPLLPCKPE